MWKFSSIYKATLWGGERIGRLHNRQSGISNIGECWMLSPLKGDESVVSDGDEKGATLSQLINKYGSGLLGEKNYNKYGDHFPLLIKLLDAADDLSIQVHPDDETARSHGLPSGKSEIWYVLEASKKSVLINGFKESTNREKFKQSLDADRLLDNLNTCTPEEGDVFYIPPGRIHALGKGIMVVEIQQAADVTYRLFDYHRKDASGKERQLHTELALNSIDYNNADGKKIDYQPRMNFPVNLVSTPEFTVNILNIDTELIRDYSEYDTFVAIVATHGNAILSDGKESMEINTGETILVKANTQGLTITPHGHFTALETYIK